MQAGVALGVEAGDPAMGALTRDPHRLGDVGDRHSEFTDALDEQPSTVHGQAGITVRHEDLHSSW